MIVLIKKNFIYKVFLHHDGYGTSELAKLMGFFQGFDGCKYPKKYWQILFDNLKYYISTSRRNL